MNFLTKRIDQLKTDIQAEKSKKKNQRSRFLPMWQKALKNNRAWLKEIEALEAKRPKRSIAGNRHQSGGILIDYKAIEETLRKGAPDYSHASDALDYALYSQYGVPDYIIDDELVYEGAEKRIRDILNAGNDASSSVEVGARLIELIESDPRTKAEDLEYVRQWDAEAKQYVHVFKFAANKYKDMIFVGSTNTPVTGIIDVQRTKSMTDTLKTLKHLPIHGGTSAGLGVVQLTRRELKRRYTEGVAVKMRADFHNQILALI